MTPGAVASTRSLTSDADAKAADTAQACARDRLTVFGAPGGVVVSELVRGEGFIVDRHEGDHSRGRCAHDGYPGCVRADALSPPGADATHRVVVRAALLFAERSIKAEVVARPPLGARLAATGAIGGAFLETEGGFAHALHVALIDDRAADPVAIASLLLGAPYLWGGRTGEGIDCSGLIQVALGLCGIVAPRDSIDQRALGRDVDRARLRRGDLVFFPGHVGIMATATDLLHANAHWMTTLIEPLADVVARLRPMQEEPIVAVRRL